MEITSFRGKTAMPFAEIMEKNEHLMNNKSRQGTVLCPISQVTERHFMRSLRLPLLPLRQLPVIFH